MLNHVLMPDTQAILLLCASFGQNRQKEPQPLKLSEYNSLTSWLRENQMRPADLLASAGKDRLQERICDLNSERLVALLERGGMLALAVESWTNKGLWVLGRSDEHYPKRLKSKLKNLAPAILYGVGNIKLPPEGGLAVVGSRDVDEADISYTQRVAATCVEQGIQVVSGGAKGVDRAAMLSTLEAGGTAVGVLADSLAKAAVDGKYRSAIREGRLTLVSPYDPNAGFNVGNAMGRNKYIYALADYALVVSCSVDKGGTWAGAIEALQRENSAPVFVWMQGTVPEGNQQLLNKGARSFPDEPWNDSLKVLLEQAAQSDTYGKDFTVEVTTAPLSLEPTKTAVDVAANEVAPEVNQAVAKDIYEAVLPFILNHLKQPQDAKSLAENLNVRPSQMQDWLKRAVAEGKVKKTTKPVAYVVTQAASQLSFF
jgi:predicted Rossmann fold nucleotide-binding protein DprA/Smf involved in DNA uptake